MGFNFPRPPSQLTFPQTAQHIANGAMAALVILALIYSIYEWRAGRGPLALILLAGGAISYLNEPMLDVLGLLWHPRPGQDVAIDTLGPVPMWGLGIYTVFFGTGTYLLYRAITIGMTRRAFWIGIAILFVVDMAVELPLIGAGLYKYYGFRTPPFDVGGLPMYWLFMNAGAPLLGACTLAAAPRVFAGVHVLRALALPMMMFAGFSLATGWPIFTALHMRTLPAWLEWGAALLTVAIGATAIHELAGWAQQQAPGPAPEPLDEPEPVPAAVN